MRKPLRAQLVVQDRLCLILAGPALRGAAGGHAQRGQVRGTAMRGLADLAFGDTGADADVHGRIALQMRMIVNTLGARRHYTAATRFPARPTASVGDVQFGSVSDAALAASARATSCRNARR